jgi:hypothetical protein
MRVRSFEGRVRWSRVSVDGISGDEGIWQAVDDKTGEVLAESRELFDAFATARAIDAQFHRAEMN